MPDRDPDCIARLPRDFESRGWAVPFTTEFLSYARLRRGADETLEYLVPGLAGGGETYVIPAGLLNDIGSLSVYDRSLLEALGETDSLNPATIRALATKIAASGLAGAGPARTARTALSKASSDSLLIHIALIQMAVAQLGQGDSAIGLAELASPEGQDRAKAAIQSYADEKGATPNEIFSVLEVWARSVAAIGSPDRQVEGEILVLTEQIRAFRAALLSWFGPEPKMHAQMAQRIAAAAKETLAEALPQIAALDQMALDMRTTLSDWRRSRARLTRTVARIEAILDGWSRMVTRWRDVAESDRTDQREMVVKCALSLPVLPTALVRGRSEFWLSIRRNQIDWRNETAELATGGVSEKLREKFAGAALEFS